VPGNRSIVTHIKGVQICHILLVQLKIINSRIGDDSLWVRAFWESNPPLLQSPTDENLGVTFSMFFRCGRDDGVIEHPPSRLNERTVCLYNDTVLLAILYDLPLLAEWMKLNLVHGWGLEPHLSDFFEVVNTMIRHADIPDLPFIPSLQ